MTTKRRKCHHLVRRPRSRKGQCRGTLLPPTEEQRERARKLLATEIEFVPHVSFRNRDVADADNFANQASSSAEHVHGVAASPALAELARLGDDRLLSAEQELELFRQMNYLKYRANVLRATLDPDAPDMNSIETAESLLNAARSIRDQIVRSNARLVMSVVKKFITPKYSFDELLSDGLLSLMKAVEKFDYSRGFRFSTYTYHALTRSAYRSISQRTHRERRRVKWSDEICDRGDESERSSLNETSWESLRGAIAKMLRQLDPRERFIVCGRFALGSQDEERTFQSLAGDLKISKERVRQIEARALDRLRDIALEWGLEKSFEAALEGSFDAFSLPNLRRDET